MLASKPDGLAIAVEILHMRLHGNKEEKCDCSSVISSLGQELLVQVNFDRKIHPSELMDDRLGQLVEECLGGEKAAVTPLSFVKNSPRHYRNIK